MCFEACFHSLLLFYSQMEVSETGLKLPGTDLFPFLKRGVMFATNQSLGRVPSSRDCWKILETLGQFPKRFL